MPFRRRNLLLRHFVAVSVILDSILVENYQPIPHSQNRGRVLEGIAILFISFGNLQLQDYLSTADL